MHCKNKYQKGIAQLVVLGVMAFLALGLPLTTKLVQQNQENRSQAAVSSVCSTVNDRGNRKCSSGKTCLCFVSTNADGTVKEARWNCVDCPSGKTCSSNTGICETKKACTPNSGKKCENGKLYTCNSSGSAWKTPTNCVTGACKSDTACSTVQTVGQKCASTYKNCTAAGVAWYCSGGKIAKKDCKANNQDCKNGACVAKPVATCSSSNCGNCGTLSTCNANNSCVWSYNGNYCKKKVACTGWKTDDWGNCSSTGNKIRKVYTVPAGCVGTPLNKPEEKQSCKYCGASGLRRCNGNNAEECVNNEWKVADKCKFGCLQDFGYVSAECKECIPKKLGCDYGYRQVCSSAGLWRDVYPYPDDGDIECEYGCSMVTNKCLSWPALGGECPKYRDGVEICLDDFTHEDGWGDDLLIKCEFSGSMGVWKAVLGPDGKPIKKCY